MLRKTLKNLFAAVLLAAFCLSLASCAPGAAQAPELTVSDASQEEPPAPKDPANYDRDVQGLCSYLEDCGVAVGDRVQMSFDVIGAKNGYKYNYRYNGSTVQLEVYEFDTANLPEAGVKTLETLRVSGKFDVVGTLVDGTLSFDERFLLVYTDAKNDEVNAAHRDHVTACFDRFAEYGTAR